MELRLAAMGRRETNALGGDLAVRVRWPSTIDCPCLAVPVAKPPVSSVDSPISSLASR
jgi:hypothetical protein